MVSQAQSIVYDLEREYKTPRVRDMFGGKMLIDEKINTKWNSKTKKYYESLGYQYTNNRIPKTNIKRYAELIGNY